MMTGITIGTINIATIYEHVNFKGRSQILGFGEHRLLDFQEIISSIKVPKGLVVHVYEHADSGGGYGRSADFLEDCADLSQFNFNEKISYITVSNAEREGFIWARGKIVNTQYMPGHWERKRANGESPNGAVAVVSPPIPPHDSGPVLTGTGTAAVPDSATVKNHVIQSLPAFTAQHLWDIAVNQQMGIIGSDFRGPEEIGSAAFERESNNPLIPDFLNFWYPQKQPQASGDHRSPYFKRTLSGKVIGSKVVDIDGTFEDQDLNMNIEPAEGYTYLITDGHRREYTDIMSAQWNLSFHQSGQPNCNDSKSVSEFDFVEAEIDTDVDAKRILNDTFKGSVDRQICVYGPWIYDKGHCCHAEIHPAEQIWWSDLFGNGRVYFCNLFCDSSERFWWRVQMDDGTKLKPWGAPPITGTFAIAFEIEINSPAKEFSVFVRKSENHTVADDHFERHNLVYQNNTLISFVQYPGDPVKVSFENVGLVVGTNTVRGFLVVEATVGTCTQTGEVLLPPNADPNDADLVPENIEFKAFSKKAGHLMLMIQQFVVSS